MKHIQIVIVGLLIHIVRNSIDSFFFRYKMRFVLDIPIDQELPDDEPGRRNKDIVNYRYYTFQSNEFGSFF